MHKRHILHRDLKSDNILYNVDGEIKLADFGCAAQLTQQKGERKTLMGTDHWIAPEVIKTLADAKQTYNIPADVWSFGIFAIEMANREPPFFSLRNPN